MGKINFGKHTKTLTPQASAITGSIKLILNVLLCGNKCLISAAVSSYICIIKSR